MAGGPFGVLSRFTRRVNRVFLALSGIIAVAIMLLILQDVVRRYAFNDPSVWAYDFSSFLLVYLFFLALAPALESGSHISVDIFNQFLPARVKQPLFRFGSVLIIGFGAVFFWQLFAATSEAFADNQLFPTATPVRVKYVWIIGPIGALQFVLTAIVLLGVACGLARGDKSAPNGTGEAGA